MSKIIVKAARDRDLYVEWSSIVDAPTAIGTRAEMLGYLEETRQSRYPSDLPEDRLRRADENGSSALQDPEFPSDTTMGTWGDDGFIVEQRGSLPRARLAEFLDAYLEAPEKAYALLDPFDDA